ncbi:hypothetical protein [Chryseobacterium indologenes]|uniref:Lauroyl/myristoyl acyltransferase n=1 Tax=Chryseobacterium indologenes TaxID=253 RepID=A0A0N0ZVM0_CHRID|nr:hypothetical protein [Chryseobacterium indologenes]KPE49069.1 hypothetical protein AOB46_21980 [Chryseobacterium indologenes]
MSILTVLNKRMTFHQAINREKVNKTRLLKTIHYSKYINPALSHEVIANKYINHFKLVEYFYKNSNEEIYEYLNDSSIEGDSDQAKIYISFHYGLYRLIPYLLDKAGKKCIIVREDHGTGELNNEFYRHSFIDCRDPGCYLKILNNLKKNINVLLFIDINNIGSDITKSQEIVFLEKNVNILDSIFKFSYKYNYKIAPLMIHYNDEGKIKTNVFRDLERNGEEEFDSYSKRCCQLIYKILEQSVCEDPVQWEQIYQLDTYFSIQNKNKINFLQRKFKLNVDYCTVYREGETYTIYNSLNNQQYAIDKHLYILLMILKTTKLSKQTIVRILNNKDSFAFLKKERIIC